MSGGYYDIPFSRLNDMIESLNEYINGHELDEDDLEYYRNSYFMDNDEKVYILKNRHSEPNKYGYDEITINHIKDGIMAIKKAMVYMNRIDYLMEGDDSEESFKKRIKEDLEKLENKK